jgi:hypothetical protein
LALLWIDLLPPSEWDSAASLAFALIWVGFLMAEQSWRAVASDLGHIKTQAFGYSLPLGILLAGIGIMVAAGYCFLRWAAP